MRHKQLILFLLTCAVGAFALVSHASVPQNMNVQGRLTDAAGDPLGPQILSFTFKIFDMEVGGTKIWPAGVGETQVISTDENGLWNANIGAILGLSPDVFSDTSRWLEFTVDDAILPPETLTRIKLNMSPFSSRAMSSKAADNGVPVGAVIDWWRPNAGFPVPDGFQICDGSMVVDPESPLNGETLPDLRNVFVRGANVIGDIGVTGGTDSHVHDVDPPSMSSSSINLAHSHSHDHPNQSTAFVNSHNSNLGALLNSSHAHVAGHSHQLNLVNIGSSTSLGSHSHTTDIGPFSSASTDNVPSYAALLKIMRIR